MAAVSTVLGPVEPGALGRTLMHEHVLYRLGALVGAQAGALRDVVVSADTLEEVARCPFDCVDNTTFEDPALAASELRGLAQRGGGAIVDLTVGDLGRDIVALRRVAGEAGVHVIASCGEYVAGTISPAVAALSAEAIAERLVRELREGVEGTGIRAGMIKVGTSTPLHLLERKSLRAASLAQARTGAPITVHLSNLGARRSNGHDVLSVLEEAGADLGRVILAHLDLTLAEAGAAGIAHHRALAARGCVLGYDTAGHEGPITLSGGSEVAYPSDALRARAIAALFEAGLGDQLVVSNDLCTKVRLCAFGGSGYGHVFEGFTRALDEAGLRAAELDALFVATPARLLAW